MASLDPITVSVTVNTSADKAWQLFTDPSSITQWNFAGEDWHCPSAQNDLRAGGSFSYRMEARDGSFGFDFAGTFVDFMPPTRLSYSLGEEREVVVQFEEQGSGTLVSQTFTPEATHSIEQQQSGWQAILDNYKAHVDAVAARP